MEIQTKKLIELMALVKPFMPKKKNTIDVIRYIKLGGGKAVATDLETMLITEVAEAQEPILLPYADISDMIKYIPDGPIKLEAAGKVLNMTWEGGSASLPTMDAASYPELRELEVVAEGSLNGDLLIPTICAALPYAATESTREVLKAVTVTLGNPVEVAAGDGYRMSHQVLPLSFPSEERAIVPIRSVYLLGHIYTKTPRTPPTNAESLIEVITARRQLGVTLLKGKAEDAPGKLRLDFGTTSVIINLVVGSAPDFLQLIPKDQPIMESQVFAPQLEASVKRVRAIARLGNGIIRMEFAAGKITISAYGGDKEVKAVMDAVITQGEPERFGIPCAQLLDFLSGKSGIISISKYTETGPLAFGYGSP